MSLNDLTAHRPALADNARSRCAGPTAPAPTRRNPPRGPAAVGVLLATVLWLGGPCRPAHAFPPPGYADPDDGALDLSEWLVDRKGFLPVPIVITEPAVGYGGGVAFMFLRNSMRESAEQAQASGLKVPPDIWVIGAAATENGSKAVFGGGMKSFDQGRWKYRGRVGRTHVNLAFYGIGGVLGDSARSIDYSLDGWTSSQQVLRRLGDSDHWVGLRWIYLDLDRKVDLSTNPVAGLRPEEGTRRASGLGLALEHDSRDNIFTPSRGWTGALDATFYDPRWGSSTKFQSYRGHVFGYWPVADRVVIGGRLDGRAVDGQVPFYMLPSIDMRGIQAARYQDRRTALVETEVRWSVTPRWAAIGFIGAGRAWGSRETVGEASTAVSKGLGLRYLIARRLGLWVGVDYARGPEIGTVYLQVGNAWR